MAVVVADFPLAVDLGLFRWGWLDSAIAMSFSEFLFGGFCRVKENKNFGS